MTRPKTLEDEIVLEKTLELIMQHGAATFTLRQVSKKVGLSPATLLQRFGTRNKLLAKAIHHHNAKVRDRLAKTRLTAKGTPEKAIVRMLLEDAESIEKPADVAAGLDILKMDIIDKDLKESAKEYFDLRIEFIENLLPKKKGRDSREIAMFLLDVWQGAIMMWALCGKGELRPHLKRRLEFALENLP